MKRISVIGTGYVGLVTGACFAELGHRVTCVDIDTAKIASLREGVLPLYEPDLEPIVHRQMRAKRLCATTSFEEGVRSSDFVFMCVGTPSTADGKVDLSHLVDAYVKVHAAIAGTRPIIVNKATVPPGTTDMFHAFLAKLANGNGPVSVVANPEFLREGHAVFDFMHPSRVVVGARNEAPAEEVAALYRELDSPILMTDPRTAEMIKYASNAFLATKVSFINDVAELCERLRVDVTDVAEGMGLDPRIGRDFLRAGIGYGGSCLPKDTAALAHIARSSGHELRLLEAAITVNARQPRRLVEQVERALGTLAGARVGVLGLTFKPNTDDTRCSPSLEIIDAVLAAGAAVRVYDPGTWRTARAVHRAVECVGSPWEAAADADAVIIATEWPEFKTLDLRQLKSVMKGNLLADGRNVVDPEDARRVGLVHIGMGRGNAGGVVGANLDTEGLGNMAAGRLHG